MIQIQVWPTMKYGVVTLTPGNTTEFNEAIDQMSDLGVVSETASSVMFENNVEIRKPTELKEN